MRVGVAPVWAWPGGPQRSLGGRVRWLRGLWRFYALYVLVSELGTLHTMVVDQRSAVTRWMWSLSPALRWGRLLLDAYTMLAFLTAYYTLLHTQLTHYHLSTALYRELGRRLEVRCGATITQ